MADADKAEKVHRFFFLTKVDVVVINNKKSESNCEFR